jgi:hypothetical protein
LPESLPDGCHPRLKQDDAHHPPRLLHRLRTVRAGVPGGLHKDDPGRGGYLLVEMEVSCLPDQKSRIENRTLQPVQPRNLG